MAQEVVLCTARLKALKPGKPGPKSPSPASPGDSFGRPTAKLEDPASPSPACKPGLSVTELTS